MIETPEPGDQDQPIPTVEPLQGNAQHGTTPRTESDQPPAVRPQQSLAEEQELPPQPLPVDELEDDDEKEANNQPGSETDPQEMGHQDDRATWQEDASFQQQQWIKQREDERLVEFSRQNITLQRFEPHDFKLVNDLFVEPEGYQDFERHIRQSTDHIFIVAGQEHSGKLMTALYLALHLWPQKALDVYQFVDPGKRTLVEIIADEQLPTNAVILFDEVFDKNQIRLDDLTNRFIHLNENLANLTNVWFIFTVLNGPHLAELQIKNFPILHTTGVNCRLVMEKLIDSFFPEKFSFGNERAELLAAREKLNPHLTPSDLYHLFEKKDMDLKVLIYELTKEKDQEIKAPHTWFNELKPMNYQLYALLVVLFDKLDMPMLEEIYTEATNALRRQGMDGADEFIDPRRIGTHLMHSKLDIQVRFNILEFRNRKYRQYVEAQVENFQRLLWSLIDPDDASTFTGLLGTIHHLSEYDLQLARRAASDARYTASSDRLRQLRYAIAVMIAQVGVYHLTKLRILLEQLVGDKRAPVSLTAAFVLAEIARRGEHFDFIEQLLRAWCRSQRFDQMWAVAASIAYIYEAIARTLEDEHITLSGEDELEEEDDTDLRGRQATMMQDQKQRGKAQLATLRNILTELVEVHGRFGEEAINEEQRNMYAAYRARLRQEAETAVEPVTDKGRLFRNLSEIEQEQYLNGLYARHKGAIDEAIRRDIGVLTNSWKNQMRMVLVQTLGHIAQMWPRDITRLIRVWLDRKDTKSPLWQIGHMALNYLFHTSISIKDASLLEQSAYPLLDLVPMAMRTHIMTLEAFLHDVNFLLQFEDLMESGTADIHVEVGKLLGDDPLVYALYAIQQWYESLSHLPVREEHTADDRQFAAAKEDELAEDELAEAGEAENPHQKSWQKAVYAVLSQAMNSAAQEERRRLRNVLFLWIKSGYPVLNRIARILISHSYVMDGIVLDLPASKRAGVVVVDGGQASRENRERIFYLLQNISAITPVHLHWLGYTGRSRFLSSDNRNANGQARSDDGITSFGPDDLQLRGANRPSLLLPVMIPSLGQGYAPEQTYFVTVFHTEPILDLAELYRNATDATQGPKGNIFKEHLQRQKATAASTNQSWRGKVYLLSPTAETALPASLAALLTVVRPESLDALEEELRRKVTTTLRACPLEDLWRDLRAYIGGPVVEPRSFESLRGEIETWLAQLSDTSALYPDVSLFILWTIMLRSRENLPEAIHLVEHMLREKAEGREDKATKKARKLRQQMGIACTRMLFYFYGVDNPTLAANTYGALLGLLPQVVACASSYTEIAPVLSVLFQLARASDWLQLLNESEGALFECISRIPARDIAPLRDWLKYDYQLIAMTRLFIEFNQSFNAFRAFGENVSRRYLSSQPARPARKGAPAPTEMDSKFLAILPSSDAQEENARYQWALQQIEFQQASLRDPDTRAATLAGLQNLEVLLNHLMNALQNRLDGTIERLKQGEYYGIVLVEAHNKTAVRQANLVLDEFVRQRRLGRGQRITLMLQRLGEKEIRAKVRNNRRKISEREISDRRKHPQLIGPLLERYPAEQVDFVLIITATPVIDYDDWVEQEHWASRLWVARIGGWHPYRGEIVALGESTQLTLETLLKRPGGERESYDHVSLLPDHAGTAANQSVQ
ncbi:hypothetical protein [Dictyobacter aurantiacus]|uniref:Uncharacterized protein n=1 Tax=Dictyobacter aurantiacus TaxID=1936993 RepID=A0A401ZMY4_9CHLR|nr:hypothetical protein [Dictyobacter aurantiacus]GCE08126.1 hypothetical protein KDAU_54550 [Dictyobacter aurantiacus]